MSTDQIAAAVAAGDIVQETAEVVISDKASPTGKGLKKSYTALYAQNAKGMAAMCEGKIAPSSPKPAEGKDERTDEQRAAGACDYFNYGFDLEVRSKIRQELMGELEGPEKAVRKAVVGLVAAGFERDAIIATLTGSPKFTGLVGLEKLIESALKP